MIGILAVFVLSFVNALFVRKSMINGVPFIEKMKSEGFYREVENQEFG